MSSGDEWTSDGSVSSRMSQFGLYRTIDARTEEFLKLSKKRQIKQGCICAAVSTALTVTVVVIFLLIYEYNVIAATKKTTHKANWLGPMNNSADDPNIIETLNKEKIEIDKTTLKLLPILLKALNRNRYIDKLIEEPTSIFTPIVKEDTTEAAIATNIFSDTRNWMKTPHSRLFTIEYKTSPIVYFKNPTRNTEYFTKIRKIRDYQRMLNYVNKMISEKNYLATTQSMKKDFGYTQNPYKMVTPIVMHETTKKAIKMQKPPPKTITEEKGFICNCCYKLNEVMNKLLHIIQQLLLYFSAPDLEETDPRNTTPLNQSDSLKSLDQEQKNIHKKVTKKINGIESKTTRKTSLSFFNRHIYSIDSSSKSSDKIKDQTVNPIKSVIKPDKAFSTTDSYMNILNTNNDLKESTTNVYHNNQSIDNTNSKVPADLVSTVADYILQEGTYEILPELRLPISTHSETNFNDDDDYLEKTEMTTHSLDLVIVNKNKRYPFKGTRTTQNLYRNMEIMRKMGNLVPKDQATSVSEPNRYRFVSTSEKPSSIPTKWRSVIKFNAKPTEKNLTLTNETEKKNIDPKVINSTKNHTNNITANENLTKAEVLYDNRSAEITLKHIEEAILILSNETIKHCENSKNNLADMDQLEMVQFEESSTISIPKVPLGRSTYLEMQRNDWKHEETHDFDNDANYLFD